MSKFFRWSGYVSTAIGFVLIILAIIGHFCHKCCSAAAACSMAHPEAGMQQSGCCMHHPFSFVAAISFLLLAITLFIIADQCYSYKKGGCGCGDGGCGCGDKGGCGCGDKEGGCGCGDKGGCGCGHDHEHEHEHEHDHGHDHEHDHK